MLQFSRRSFVSSAAAAVTTVGLAGCSSSGDMPFFDGGVDTTPTASLGDTVVSRPNYAAVYGSYPGEPFPVLAFDYSTVDPRYLRQEVTYTGPGEPGTIVVHPGARQLFLVERNGRATRYGVGVGREGFLWSGQAQINMRRSWPDWIPPHAMVERDPDIRARLVQTPRGTGVPGGPRSPLGARAMYLFSKEGDTGYRIHGTTEPQTIGTNVSSGCIRMVNQDIIHLYGRAPDGTKVVVLGA